MIKGMTMIVERLGGVKTIVEVDAGDLFFTRYGDETIAAIKMKLVTRPLPGRTSFHSPGESPWLRASPPRGATALHVGRLGTCSLHPLLAMDRKSVRLLPLTRALC
jgi:hypothetical protein